MSSTSERRVKSDRRKAVRGGRRPDDLPGSAPLVLVVGNGRDPRQEAETILGELRFAVAPAADVSEALRIVKSLRPDLIVARPADALRLRADKSVGVPIVEYDGDGLVERLRKTIRKGR
jgi:CheY-like chemotaxis protein